MITCSKCHQMNPDERDECSRCGEALREASASLEIQVGSSLGNGRYSVTKTLGEGGMGNVYQATDTRLGIDVALKVLHANLVSHPTARIRMTQEAKALARIDHPNVVRIFDVFDEGPNLVLVLKLVTGGSLEDALGSGAMAEEDALRMMDQVLVGLQAVHDAGLIHRDIKPANILVDKSGTPRLTDLGVAHDNTRRGMTSMGSQLGTPEYMSPEQHRGEAVDSRSDIYSCGVMLYELLTAEVPFTGKSNFDVAAAHVQQALDLSGLEGRISAGTLQIIATAMDKEPDARWASAKDMQSALHGEVSAPAVAPTVVEPARVVSEPETVASPPEEPIAEEPAKAPKEEVPVVEEEPEVAPPQKAEGDPPTTKTPSKTIAWVVGGLLVLAGAGYGVHMMLNSETKRKSRDRVRSTPTTRPPATAAAQPAPETQPVAAPVVPDEPPAPAPEPRVSKGPLPEGYVLIKGGSFAMGSPVGSPLRDADEGRHQVTFTNSFVMQAKEVTQAQWRSVMGTNPSRNKRCNSCPVENVRWTDAVQYLNKLSDDHGLARCMTESGYILEGSTVYDCEGFRLPTEAEWEYAARAGFGPTVTDWASKRLAWSESNAKRPKKVGQLQANAWGLYDMLGNVSEWTSDSHQSFGSSSVTDPYYSDGQGAVYRGGSYKSGAKKLRFTFRAHSRRAYKRKDIGFRPVRSW